MHTVTYCSGFFQPKVHPVRLI
ncbi:protein of unknown function (plasmid) [Cupriavidus taiwanensis]|uniref:Uncharacterized protein n=1 Tax=Cupriavidus taiwanensis TaxID=164546 RepID=A0A375IRG5_9BURK|nr:protein of unknown function [Cupriavidus taiwanensis]